MYFTFLFNVLCFRSFVLLSLHALLPATILKILVWFRGSKFYLALVGFICLAPCKTKKELPIICLNKKIFLLSCKPLIFLLIFYT
jgi:hypothetical protein